MVNKRIKIRESGESGFDFKGASLGEFALAAGGLGEDVFAVVAGDDGLCVAKDYCGFVAASALHVHEVGIGSGY